MGEDKPNWQRMRFKKNKVWMAIDDDGSPTKKKGKVLIKYQLDQAHEYWVNTENISPIESEKAGRARSTISPATPRQKKTIKKIDRISEEPGFEVISIYTDGAASGNPGPAGIGVVMQYGQHEKEISRYIGETTNNIAELEAIRTGLTEVKKKDLPVRVYTDSSYAYGVLTLGWKARKNRELVDAIRKIMRDFNNLKLIKVRGHAGHQQNEHADQLATSAVKNRSE